LQSFYSSGKILLRAGNIFDLEESIVTQSEVEKMLIDVVCEIQNLSGRTAVPVSGLTCPILDVPGFDSLNGVEATIEAIDRLNQELDYNNVFVDNDKALTIREAATRLLGCIQKKPKH
jgi:hypothetical protein